MLRIALSWFSGVSPAITPLSILSLKTILCPSAAFVQYGNNHPSSYLTEIIIGSGIQSIANNAFRYRVTSANTINHIVIDINSYEAPEGVVNTKRWGATNAIIDWKDREEGLE